MQTIKLDKKDKLLIGLSWENTSYNEEFDMDLMAIKLDKNHKFLNKSDLIFYNNLSSRAGALFHTGDNKTGNSQSDDEVILVDLERVPKSIKYIRFAIFNNSPEKKSDNVSFRIAKIDGIFDTKGTNIFTHKFEDCDFIFVYIFEIQISDDECSIDIELKKINDYAKELFKMYNIQVEQIKTTC